MRGVDRVKRQRDKNRSESMSLYLTPALKAELMAEAWEEQRSLSDYIFGLLQRRGKWARSVGKAGGYDLAVPARPKKD